MDTRAVFTGSIRLASTLGDYCSCKLLNIIGNRVFYLQCTILKVIFLANLMIKQIQLKI